MNKIMSQNMIDKYSTKVKRKQVYIKKLISYFNLKEHEKVLNQFDNRIQNDLNETDISLKELNLISLNNQLKIFKRELENTSFRRFSNTRAFHLKASLKGTPLVLIYDQLFTTLEKKGNFPDILDLNVKVFLFPQDILALETQRLLVKTKPSNNIKLSNLETFVNQILNSYNHVAYHNFSHAFSVMQLFHFMVRKSRKISELLCPELIYTGLIGCISHDLAHRKHN